MKKREAVLFKHFEMKSFSKLIENITSLNTYPKRTRCLLSSEFLILYLFMRNKSMEKTQIRL